MKAAIIFALFSVLVAGVLSEEEKSQPGLILHSYGTLSLVEKRSVNDDFSELIDGVKEDLSGAKGDVEARLRDFANKVRDQVIARIEKEANSEPETVRGKISNLLRKAAEKLRG